MNDKILAVSYMRYSSHNQDEKSIKYQRRVIREYCEAKGIELVKEYIDEGITGTIDRRESFQNLLKDAKNKPEWNLVVIYDFSRFSRKLRHFIDCVDDLEDIGIDIESATQPTGKSNEGKLLRNIMFAINEFYTVNGAKHVHDSLLTKANSARHCGGKPPLGYDTDDEGNYVINEREAEIVKYIFDMYQCGHTYSMMVQELANKGYTNKNGKAFTKNSFSGILTQEKYKGTYTWNKAAAKDNQGRRNSHKYKSLDEQVRIDKGCPAIVSEKQFEAVAQRMNKGKSKTEVSVGRNKYMLSGMKILKCAECGAYMIGTKNNSHGKEYDVYYCPNHKIKKCSMPQIKAENLNKMVAGLIVRDIYNRDDFDEIIKITKRNNELKALKDRINGKEKAINNIVKAFENGCSLTMENKLKKLQAEKELLEDKYMQHIKRLKDIQSGNMKKVLNKFGKYLITSHDPAVKNYIKDVIETITIGHDDVVVKYRSAVSENIDSERMAG